MPERALCATPFLVALMTDFGKKASCVLPLSLWMTFIKWLSVGTVGRVFLYATICSDFVDAFRKTRIQFHQRNKKSADVAKNSRWLYFERKLSANRELSSILCRRKDLFHPAITITRLETQAATCEWKKIFREVKKSSQSFENWQQFTHRERKAIIIIFCPNFALLSESASHQDLHY